MFQHLGQWIARRPVEIVLVWAALVVAGAIWASHERERPPADVGSFLPPGHPVNRTNELVRAAFPKLDSRSQIVAIAYRPEGLTPADFAWLGQLGEATEARMHREVLSPAVPFLRHRLVSHDQQAAMLVIGLPNNFISAAAAASVKQFEAILADMPPPDGLTVEITGTAGIGRDYGLATERALHRTTWVTIVAVLLILVLVYRSPAGALVPLVAIGASVYLAMVLLAVLTHFGWEISTMEHIFAVVLIFGMGVDFALFWIARYREELQQHGDFDASAQAATRFSGPAILVSAATTICGLSTLIATDLTPTRSAGKILPIVLIVALLAALTLTPALARRLGSVLFWPIGFAGKATLGEQRIWPVVADFVTRKPKAILAVGLVALGVPALIAVQLEPRFDSLSELPPGSSSRRGSEIANAHFAKGLLYSNQVLLRFGQPLPIGQLHGISSQIAARIAAVPGVHDVYSLDAPLGRRGAGASAHVGAAMAWLGQSLADESADRSPGRQWLGRLPLTGKIAETGRFIRTYYLSQEPQMLRFEVLIDALPFSPEAMRIMQEVVAATEEMAVPLVAGVSTRPAGGAAGLTTRPSQFGEARPLAEAESAPEVLATGLTPYILGVREVTSRDQIRIKILASLVIAAIVFSLIRDLALTLFMMVATWLTYGAAIAASEGFFVWVMGEHGLDWKVRLIVFVIIVAVGQDYNIFLVSRLFQEPSDLSEAEAARRAIIRTGSVISNCGLIMAATLGSLWAGGLGLLRQVGFALALGILLDTFFVRPLLLPSFFLATQRRRRTSLAGENATSCDGMKDSGSS
ncbi:MAG TPA: MMPL family transporter [Phycisphaerae bacterium]|nr:MMPL family transporter [Phycisphaerae bacterium]HOJ75157.1 MMPL family transporter [Phycisphaerae bacterium]HOM52387.1 MMPL family transporter [Phycisphaerae bacterium]HON67226.1 MMPL family transporter [Phycisphaerae bacterium]HOQ88005.1 MMPL family transporter [Phycisphaerae bacterium]